MLLYFLALAFCTFNQIAVEYGRIPITRVSIDGKQIKQSIHSKMAANYSNDKICFSKEITPSSLYNIHLFLEENFSLENQTFVSKSNKLFKFSDLETEVDRNSLISLYFNSLLSDNYQIKSSSSLNVSSRDYFTPKENKDLCSIFGSLGYNVRSIPESLAACIQSVEFGISSPIVKNYFLNFKGSKVIGSLYEITQDNNSIKISLVEQNTLNLKSDYELENSAATLIINQLKDNVSYLPYRKCEDQYYSDIQNLALDYLRDLKGELTDFPILEVNYYDKSTGQKSGSVTDKSISFNLLRNEISTDMVSNFNQIIKSIPEDANKFIISDIPYREKFANGFSLVYWDNIAKGLLLAHDTKYVLTDSRIAKSDVFGYSSIFTALKNEIDLRYKVNHSVIPSARNTIQEFKFLTESERSHFLSMIENNDSSIKSLNNIKNTWESLQKLNTRREADSICRNENIRNLELAITNAKNLSDKIDISAEKDFSNTLEESIKWLESAREDPNATEFVSKATRLNAYVNYINKKIKQAEEKRIADELKAQEDFKKAIEAQTQEIDQKSNGDLNNEENEKQIEVKDSNEPSKHVDSQVYTEEIPEEYSAASNHENTTIEANSEKGTLKSDHMTVASNEEPFEDEQDLTIDVDRDDDSFKNRIL